jgi:hypothetical protein
MDNAEQVLLRKWRRHSVKVSDLMNELETAKPWQVFSRISLRSNINFHMKMQKKYSLILSEVGFW